MGIKKLFITLIIIILSVPAISQHSVRTAYMGNAIPVSQSAFTFGEKLTYKIKYSLYFNINVGEVTFEVMEKPRSVRGKECYHVVSLGRTYNFYDRFFTVRNRYESFISTDNFLPQLFIRNVHEGNYKKQENVSFNHNLNKAVSTNRTQEIPSYTQDVLSALYFARNIDYSKATPGDSFLMHTFLDDTTFLVGVRFAGKEQIRTSNGRFNTIILKPILVVDRVFKNEEDMVIWVTDDMNKIPVRIKSAISVGSIVAELDDFKGIRHRLTSRVR